MTAAARVAAVSPRVERVQAADCQPADLGTGHDHPAQAPAGDLAGERARDRVDPDLPHRRAGEQADGGGVGGGQRAAEGQLGAAGRRDHPPPGRGELHEGQTGRADRRFDLAEQAGEHGRPASPELIILITAVWPAMKAG